MKVAKLNAHAILDEKIEKEDYTKVYICGIHLNPDEFIAGNAKWLSENFDELTQSEEALKITYEVLGKGVMKFLLNEKEYNELVAEVKQYDQG